MKSNIPTVTIITVNHNGKGLLKDYFESVHSLEYPRERLEMVMVDNCSRDGSVEFVKKNYPAVRVLKSAVNNYCSANNLAIRGSNAEFVALLNNDVRVTNTWLAQLMNVMRSNPRISTAGGKILFTDGRIQSTGHVEFPYFYLGDRGTKEKDNGKYGALEKIQSVSNSSALYRREALREIGYFDEDFHMYMEDVDVNYRLRKKNWSVVYVPQGVAYHILHGSGQSEKQRLYYVERNRLLFIAKHFPEKLPESLYGFGEIARFSRADFQKIIAAVVDKLQQNRDKKKTENLMNEFQRSVDKINDFRAHCFSIDLEKKTSDFRVQLSEEERKRAALQDVISNRDAQLRSFQEALEVANRQLNGLTAELKLSRDEITLLTQEVANRDVQLKLLQEALEDAMRLSREETARLAQVIAVRDAQLKSSQETLEVEKRQSNRRLSEEKASRDEIARLAQDKAVRDAQLNSAHEAIEEYKRAGRDEIARYIREITTRDAQLIELRDSLERNGQQLSSRLAELAICEDDRARCAQEIAVLNVQLKLSQESHEEQMIQSQAAAMQMLQQQSSEHLRIIAGQHERLVILEKENMALRTDSSTQAQAISDKQQQISKKDAAITDFVHQLEQLCKTTENLDKLIAFQKAEIDSIYNSETYRWIAKPLIWPIFSFLKKAKVLFRRNHSQNAKKAFNVSIASLSAETIVARYAQDNKYAIKLINNSLEPQEVKLLMDLWPSQNRYHPERHYAFFSTIVCLPAKESVEIVFTYDWGTKTSFCVDWLNLEILDSWRGQMQSQEFYQVCAYVYTKEKGCELDNKAILQKLQR